MKFSTWLIIELVLFLINPAFGIWGAIISGFFLSDTDDSEKPYSFSDHSNDAAKGIQHEYMGTCERSGDMTYCSNGNSCVHYGNISYSSNGVRSLRQGNITYFFDDNGHRLGRSVDHGNGVCYYYNDDGIEVGHSYSSGGSTDFFGQCFEI